ncbi:MAG: hypothetical protein ACRDZU_07250 [Acidimicrobiales bacterium]
MLARRKSATMVLDARHRSSIYQKLVPLLGDDDANALMSEFPSYDGDELVTKQFLRAEMAELETRITTRLGAAIAASTSIMLAAVALLR